VLSTHASDLDKLKVQVDAIELSGHTKQPELGQDTRHSDYYAAL